MKIHQGRAAITFNMSVPASGILRRFEYKNILDRYHRPDEYLVFSDGESVLPLSIKDGLATFFGGTRHNHVNTVPNNPELLDSALTWLVSAGYRYQLLSITNDCRNVLDQCQKVHEVPYPPTWIYRGIALYNANRFIESFTGKYRWSMNRVLKRTKSFKFRSLALSEFSQYFSEIYRLHCEYFRQRGMNSAWENPDQLYELLEYFEQKEKLLIRIVTDSEALIGFYILVYNNHEMIFYIGGSLDYRNHYISKGIYFDLLEQASELSKITGILDLNGLRGAYDNKRRFNFTPVSLYALVVDNRWVISQNDIQPNTQQHYG